MNNEIVELIEYCRKNVKATALPYSDERTLTNKVFCVTTNDITSGANTSEAAMAKFVFHNNSSTKSAKIYRITFGTNVSTNNNIYRVYRDPVVTGTGTLLTPANLLVAETAAPSEMKCYVGANTVSSNGILMMNWIAGPTSTDSFVFSDTMIVAPGKKLLFLVRPNTTNVTYSLNLFWLEE